MHGTGLVCNCWGLARGTLMVLPITLSYGIVTSPQAWNELPQSVRTGGRPSKEDALLAVAVVNRIRRALADISDATVNRIGNVSVAFGRAFGVERWAYDLFAEEVIRGGPAFAVSLVITAIEPTLRNAAALGAWQVRRAGWGVCRAAGLFLQASCSLSIAANGCLLSLGTHAGLVHTRPGQTCARECFYKWLPVRSEAKRGSCIMQEQGVIGDTCKCG